MNANEEKASQTSEKIKKRIQKTVLMNANEEKAPQTPQEIKGEYREKHNIEAGKNDKKNQGIRI